MKISTFSFFLLAILAFSSCSKENLKGKKDYDKETCFDLVYPVTYTMADGSTVTGDDEETVWAGLKEWYKMHPNSKDKYDLVYPVDVTVISGETKTIENEEEMIVFKKECDEGKVDWDKKECFEMVYPLIYTMLDGTSITVNSEKEMDTAFKPWYNENPNSEEKPVLVYPVSITLEDGVIQTVEDEAGMISIKENCDDGEG